jgi:sarcosine oxidase, subunit alpha
VSRLSEQPGERIDRVRVVSFEFDGKRVEALEGDTIGSALYAAGQRTFSRSFKYHRRRGLLCCAGQCPNCLVAVDGAPGVRACTEPVREGMRVEHMNASPSLDFDLMAATDRFAGPFTPPGFYYKTFMRPRRLWPLYEKLLRNAAGIGRLSRKPRQEREWRTEYRRRHTDVLVVGGGEAGLSAAVAAAELGADVVLVDEGPEPGGWLLVGGDRDRAAELVGRARSAGVEILVDATALGYFDGMVPVWQGDTLHQVRARRHVFATGAIEQPLVFAGNDLPGVMLSGGARRLISLYAVKPGTVAVVATTSDRGIEAALALHEAGVSVPAVADLRPAPGPQTEAAARAGIEVLQGFTVSAAKGRRGVTGVVLTPVDTGTNNDVTRSFDCDLLVVSGGFAPASSLISQAGGRTAYDAARAHFAVSDVPAGSYAAGDVAGAGEGKLTGLSGAIAGLEATLALGLGDGKARGQLASLRSQLASGAGAAETVACPPPVSGNGRGKCFACVCEDVTAKDIRLSVKEGYDSIELCKRYTTVMMGPCQGRMCQLPAVRLMASETGQTLEEVGTTTARPPWSTVPLGALAGRPFEPAKRTPIHARQREQGATVMWAGDWRRAYDYGDPVGEAMAVQQSGGIIDVSTLGKLLVRGPEASEFLDRLYPNRFSNLKPGRVRYGVLTTDAGRITDDGTICRLDRESFYVTTTSSGAGAVEQWFAWWLADWRMDATLTDLTQGLAAVNLAGPRAREILTRVCDLDVSNEAFPYLDGQQGEVAGAPSLILRIGFVGELGYEIHYPSAYGEHVWDRILDAGSDFDLRPFGLEPQRVLRLQKMHVLVGQDTDSESNPYGAAMPWIVKLDKEEDFIGKWALQRAAEVPGETALVGFTLTSGDVPTEGSVVLSPAGAPLGQVTSARRSPKLGQTIGLAWVAAELAVDDAEITISDQKRRISARVVTRPFYDPDGVVLRS